AFHNVGTAAGANGFGWPITGELMAGEWQQRGFSQDKRGGYVRTLSQEEMQHFKAGGELLAVVSLPVREEMFAFDRGFAPPRRIFAHHERIWPGTHPGRTKYGWPSRPRFPTRQRPRLIVSK